MAKQTINVGATVNDGTGDILRDAMIKTNDNFTELYDDILSVRKIHGWGWYGDGETAPATQTFNTTPSKLQIDGATTLNSYLPLEIRGSDDLWDVVNDKIKPISTGDSYTLRIDFTITGETANPNILTFVLDIGGGASPTIPVVERYISTGKTTPYVVSIGFPIYCLATFVTNGGQIFLSTDTGSITVGKRGLLIDRISSGSI